MTQCSAQPRYEHKRGDSVQPHTAFRNSTDPVPRATDLGPYADFVLACEPRTYFRSKRPPEIRLRFVGLLFLARHAILLRQERVTRP